jgi:hypothetical protein
LAANRASKCLDDLIAQSPHHSHQHRCGDSQRLSGTQIRHGGIQLLELASDAHQLFLEQEPKEKRRLLAFMVSSASWKEGELSVNLRQPFNLIRDGVAAATAAERSATNGNGSRTGRVLALSNSTKRPISNSEAVGLGPSQGKMANWLRDRDSNPEPCG